MPKMIFRTIEISPYGTNCYIVASEQTRDAMIIDPAGEARKILNSITELNLKVAIIVLTHTHPDHIGALNFVKQSTGALFAVHPAEMEQIANDPSSQIARLPVPDMKVKDGDTINVGDLAFRVLHTPGHTRGGICIAGYGAVFSGDTLFNSSIGRTDGAGGDYNQLIASIKSKLLVLPDQTAVLPGHGGRTTIGYEKANNQFLR